MVKFNEDKFKISFIEEQTRVHYNKPYVVAELIGIVTTPTLAGDDSFVVMEPFIVQAKGMAKAMDGDEYDAETGRRIALAKAENKVYEKAKNKIMAAINAKFEEVAAAANIARSFCEKTDKVKVHNLEYIEKVDNGAFL